MITLGNWFPIKLNVFIPYDPVTPLLDLYSGEMSVYVAKKVIQEFSKQ